MNEYPFRFTTVSYIGTLIHKFIGPSYTLVTKGPESTNKLVILTDDPDAPKGKIICKRYVYRTQYKRWWMPDRQHVIFKVSIDIPEDFSARFNSNIFITKYYPLLCNAFLKWTTYPHICAINAYIDDLTLNMKIQTH